MAMDLEEFQLVLLRRPAVAAELDEATADRLQAGHLAFYAGLRRTGEVVTNGPMRDQPDEALRGMARCSACSRSAVASSSSAATAGRRSSTSWNSSRSIAMPVSPPRAAR